MKTIRWFACAIFFFFLVEAIYFFIVFNTKYDMPIHMDLVLVYSGYDDRVGFVHNWSEENKSVQFLFSGYPFSREELEKHLSLGERMLVEERANTTDQNARYSSPLIKKTGVKNVVLALPWYHLPRALILTRFYLWGSGVSVQPYATTPIPEGWWLNSLFWREIVKFWGSWGRVFLSGFGVENWPKSQLFFSR